ncbi:hypothetical protein SRB17_85610 [Streptomyces sp. RB17]|uniref:hypothetical protein n=1 Tax=Streptomyces sp. RB17 TaxID=2585197 RepID=UPI001295F6F6|nr:hypothetical protein [Streptomyces sp. RB17]MQY40528.1 hypothetical protein [Streptomyces sp. RB17]
MKKLTKRIAVAVSSVAVAGVAVVGAGGTASAATPTAVHVQRSAEVNPADYRWDHSVGYLTEQGYCWDGKRGWHHDDHVAGSLWHSRDGRCYRWDDEGRGWKSDRSYRHDWNRYESDGWAWDHHDWNRGDRDYFGWDHHDRNHRGWDYFGWDHYGRNNGDR